jgi:hypothetical protein
MHSICICIPSFRFSVYSFVYVCMYVRIHVWVYVNTEIYTSFPLIFEMHVCFHKLSIHVLCIHAHTQTHTQHKHTPLCVFSSSFIHAYTHTLVCVFSSLFSLRSCKFINSNSLSLYTNTHTHTHKHTHTHTSTQTHTTLRLQLFIFTPQLQIHQFQFLKSLQLRISAGLSGRSRFLIFTIFFI